MLDPDLVAIATGAGGNIVASMITSGALATRARVAEFFRRGSHDEQSAAVDAYDRDTRALVEWARAVETNPELATELTRAQLRLSQEWTHRMVEYVEANCAAQSDLEALAGMTTVSNTGSQHNTGAGTFVNGTVFGGVHNSYNKGSH